MEINDSDEANVNNSSQNDISRSQEIKQGAAFVALRYFDNALWVAGVAGGLYAQNKLGIPTTIAAPLVGVGVTSVEYEVSGKAVQIFKRSDHNEINLNQSIFIRNLKDAGALGYASWAGSTSTVEVNNSFGLESNKIRRFGQAAIYGLGTALWTTDITPYKQAREAATTSAQYWLENPVEGTFTGTGISLGIYGILRGIKSTRRKISKWKKEKNIQDIKDI